jgi:hypothetical protein
MDDHDMNRQQDGKNNAAAEPKSIASEQSRHRGRPSRTEYLQHLEVDLPSPTPAPSMLHVEPVSEAPASIHTDYPRLRTRLNDMGLPFRAKFNQAQTAQVIGVSDRTIREWTNSGKMPSCRYPSRRPYYTPGNIETHLIECESPCSSKATN